MTKTGLHQYYSVYSLWTAQGLNIELLSEHLQKEERRKGERKMKKKERREKGRKEGRQADKKIECALRRERLILVYGSQRH